ncbi:hypothetical protein [Microbulbifer yueqingensis]|uniref:Uncharacterized protein n=1 Tax=Microbulbifer yueqingensis TaxID=658219 RepID=A0A1G8V6P0_9GAMM|nr:hypothetical protein [Microbulbifer yueqingensis]SDJ60995.1 hypothetical protein SAMN05216212_0404 [Microbulbifer yueqingensis]
MWNLIKCECLRFRKWALGLTALHLLLLGYLYIGGALRPSEPGIAYSAAILYALVGLAFGLVQVGGYRRPSQWVFLVHRPLAPARIWLSLVAAALLLITIAIVAPLYLVLLGVDFGSAQDFDLRFYLLPPYLFGLVFSFYLCGTFVLLSSSRAALLVLALPALFLTREAGLWIFLPQLAVIGLLLWLNRCAFKPDQKAQPKSAAALVPTALAIQWGLYYTLYAVASLTFQFGQMALNQHPNSNPVPDTPHSIVGMEDTAAMQYAFGENEAPLLKRELAIAEVHRAYAGWNHFPFPQQLPFADRGGYLLDKARNVQWHFSHDRMLFKGINSRSGADAGWMGRSGRIYPSTDGMAADEYFREIPLVVDETTLVTPRELYRADFDSRRLELLHALENDEEYRSGPQLEGKMAVAISNRNLYFFDAFSLRNGHELLQPDATVALPGSIDNLHSIYVAELADGYAVSFLYGTYERQGWSPALLVSGLLPLGGEFSDTSTRPLQPSFSDWFIYKQYLISPLLAYLSKATWSAIEPRHEGSVSLHTLLSRPIPVQVRTAMLVSALLCALLTALLSRRTQLESRGRAIWITCNAFTGIPGLLTFLCLSEWREADRDQAAAEVAQRAQLA